MAASWYQERTPPRDLESDVGSGLTWRPHGEGEWAGSWAGQARATVVRDRGRWVGYLRLDQPPGGGPPITPVPGRYETPEQAMVEADDLWAAHRRDAPGA